MNPKRLGLQAIEVHFGVFNTWLLVVIGQEKAAAKYAKHYFEDEDCWPTEGHLRIGRFMVSNVNHELSPMLWLPRRPRTPKEYGTLAHECMHAVYQVMNWADLSLNSDTEEAYCHSIGFLVTKILTEAK